MKTTILTAAFSILLSQLNAQQKTSILGFQSGTAAQQLLTEQQFDKGLQAANIDQLIKKMSAVPHHVGSAGDSANAQFILQQFKSWGYDAEIETFHVLFPTPVTRLLELKGPVNFKAALKEPAIAEDGTSNQTGLQLPVYNCWSADGDVTAPLVYVNYGVPADYEMLARMGVDVKGKIVIARYGRSWRGIKPKLAQEHGAIGCIIYSDPKEDGYYNGDVYPKGPYRPSAGVQRGSVEDIPIYPGDPLTPGVGATLDAPRLNRKDCINLLKIPVIPISYADAQPLLASLGGAVVPDDWRGALPITYHVGPGAGKVHLQLSFDWQIRPVNNIIATLKGSTYPDQWVLRGNHHDAWVNGASDPISGEAAMMEEARMVGELVKTGWQPKRTIKYCSWDGEEQGLLGSTEWVEFHAAELQQKVVLYINSDANGRGFLFAGGSHALEAAFSEITQAIQDPQKQVSIFQRKKSYDLINAASWGQKKNILNRKSLELSALGSGSDYSPFIQHLGIPALNLGFGGEDDGGEYHSIYDSYDLYKKFKDPGFEYGVLLAKTAGHTTLRFANAEVLPFDFRNLQTTVARYVNDLIQYTDDLREQTNIDNQLITANHYQIGNQADAPLLPPTEKLTVPFISFAVLQNAVASLDSSCNQLAALTASGSIRDLASFNQQLFQAEQSLLIREGLPRREWYKHAIYAPGFYTGYGVKTLPGVREAIEQRNWKEADEQMLVAAHALQKLSLVLNNLYTQYAPK